MKKVVCVILTLMFCFAMPFVASAKDSEENFVPSTRFLLASDTHFLDYSDINDKRVPKMIELAYSVADSDPDYKGLDALLVAGDLTNDGTEDEFVRFWNCVSTSLRKDTRFLGVVAQNHDGYEMKQAQLREYYKNLTGNDADFHVVIGGYHFIGISVSPKQSKRYDKDQLNWLKKQLDEAVAQDKDKPVFVMHHEHSRNTVYGSALFDGWGITHFKKILQQYPQVVEFSGHSHYPLNDPRSIWQGEYTAVGTGAIFYSEFTVEGHRTYHPEDYMETSTCWIVELDKDSNMRFRGYDVDQGKLLCEKILKNPANPENREYTPEKREADSVAPEFDENAALDIEAKHAECIVNVPAAACSDGEPVVLYRAKVKNKSGVTVAKQWLLPPYYRAIDNETVSFDFTALGTGEYTVSVTAENAYGKESAPIEASIQVEGDGLPRVVISRIGVWFGKVKQFFSCLFG